MSVLIAFGLVVAASASVLASSKPLALQKEVNDFPVIQPSALNQVPSQDWLISRQGFKAKIYREGSHAIVLTNGLIERTIRVTPDAATVSIRNLVSQEEMIRAVGPEALITLNGKTYSIGGLVGQEDRAFLTETDIQSLKEDPNTFHLAGIKEVPIHERFPWQPSRFGKLSGEAKLPNWPPKGVGLEMIFNPPTSAPNLAGVQVTVHYELFDNYPLYAKWLEVQNNSHEVVTVNHFTNELLNVVEAESAVANVPQWLEPHLQLFTNYTFGGDNEQNAEHAIQYLPDPKFETQVNYDLTTPCVLITSPPLGPDADVKPSGKFESFDTFGLFHDSTDRERNTLEFRLAMRMLAPWTAENPIFFHLTDLSENKPYEAIDECAKAGFEMVILSFGSGLNMEDVSAENIAKYKKLADYAHSKGILIGGYSLLASRDLGPKIDVIDPKTGKPGAIFGASPCLSSQWGHDYFEHLKTFISETGFDCLENDGSYPGDPCASTKHKFHKGLDDSVWTQFAEITDFYHWCREHDIYLNVPDWYFLQGSNKTGMGYRETNWSLPRAWQIIHARQNLFDGTWEKSPSMGWMFVPLVQYHGGGSAATLEPLKDHLPAFQAHLTNDLAYGAQAAYRGWRLYDSPETESMIAHWVNWYKKHRKILESEVIHGARADGRNVDWIVHVNPISQEKALAAFWNPTDESIQYTCWVPLYYSGLKGKCSVTIDDGNMQEIQLDLACKAKITITVPAGGFSWAVFSK